MKNRKIINLSITIIIGFFGIQVSLGQTPSQAPQNDTIRVMAYNTLGFGPGSCQDQGSNTQDTMLHLYAELKTIVQFSKPDIIGLDKMQCVKVNANDNGISSQYFPDTIISECLDTSFSFCHFTDLSGCADGASDLIFYNHNKVGYVSTTPIYYGGGVEDFDLYKLYYKDPLLSSTRDTTFLYVVLCHTISGSSSTGRDLQATDVIDSIKVRFGHMPNLIYMGDFNTRSSSEPGYELITQTSDTSFIMDDPPFFPDAKLTYPLNWQSNATACSKYLTTTTRATTLPNSCGTTGGAKDWYDHIFLSHWIINGVDFLSYIKNSYTTIGNDGNRLGISVNTGTNSSVPSKVANALFNFSDKYPVMVSLVATSNPTPLGINNPLMESGNIKINNPVGNSIIMHFAASMNGQDVIVGIYDVCGRMLNQSNFTINRSAISKEISLTPGVYFIHFTSGGYSTTLKVIKE